MLDDLRRPSSPRLRAGVPRAAALALTALTLAGCVSPREERAAIVAIDQQWRDDVMAEDSLEELVEHVRALAGTGAHDATALASIVSLVRVAATSPAQFARAEALNGAWKLAAVRPQPEFREDDVDAAAFSERTRRYDELVNDPLQRDGEEARQLIEYMGTTRFPVSQLKLAVDLADLMVSQSLWGNSPALREAFAPHAEACALHALTAATLAASTSNNSFVRQIAVENATHLPTELALNLIGNTFDNDPETLVALAAMGSLEQIADDATDAQLAVLLRLAQRRDEPALSERAVRLERAPELAPQP